MYKSLQYRKCKISLSTVFLSFSLAFLTFSNIKAQPVEPVYPLPTQAQMEWHQMEYYLFIHFGPNTFTGLEWGKGTENPEIFNPTALDAGQWARIAKQSGAKGIILTAKHHDGFCLYPSKFSKHTVRESKWKNGKGDVLQEFADACRKEGLLVGVYLSPWDRNHSAYGTPKYNRVYLKTMKEVVKKYGPLFEMWWDGANGEGPNGKKQVYDFRAFEKAMRKWSPNTIIFSDIGPDARWIGNEKGIAGETNWALLDTAGFKRGEGGPSQAVLNQGNSSGRHYIPGEADVSIRPGWFYHTKDDDKVKTGEELFDLYLKSVGRNANFLLNVPPDQRGLFHEKDSASLIEFKKIKDAFFKNNQAESALVHVESSRNGYSPQAINDGKRETHWAPGSDKSEWNISFDLIKPVIVKAVQLQEYIELGQRVSSFTIEVSDNGKDYSAVAEATTIGYKRIITFNPVKTRYVRINILESKAVPVIAEIGIF